MDKKLELLMQLTKVSSIASRRLSGHGLAFSDFMILYLISNALNEKLRRIDLAELMGLTASGVTRMILPLEKLKILEREENDKDAREKYSKLTKAGRELFKDARKWMNLKVEDFLPKIEEKELSKILKIFEEIKSN